MPPALLRVTTTRLVPRHLVGAVAITLVAALIGWLPASPAAAHGELVSSDPSEGGVIEALPSRAVLTFSDAISTIREITIAGPDGSVANGEPTSAGPEVRQNLWAGPDGAYTMTYYVVSLDGHDVRGEVHFEVGGATSAVSNDADADADAGAAAPSGDWGRGRDVLLPGVLVLLAAATALVLLRRHRLRRSRVSAAD